MGAHRADETAAVRAAEPVSEIPDERLHDWWRTRPALADPKSEDAQLFRRRAEPLASSRVRLTPFDAVSLGLDLAEQCIAEATSPTWLPVDLTGLEQSGQCTAEQLIRVTLRMLALGHPVFDATCPPPPGADSSAGHWARQADQWTGVGRRVEGRELAMDEGELLALRLPREAVSLLEVAASWFSEADDPAGALFATIAGTRARQRSGMPVPAGISQSLSGTYDAMASRTVVPLPTWANLVGEYLLRPSRQLDKPAESAMGGWLPRLAACLARDGAAAKGITLRPDSPARVETMLKTTPGSVPAELDLSRPTRRRARRRRAGPRFRVVRWLLRFFASFTLVYLAVSFVAAAVIGIVLLLSVALRPNTGTGIAAAIIIAIVTVMLALAAVAAVLRWTIRGRRLAARARARRWSKSLVWLRIMPAPSTGAAGDIRVAVNKWQAVPRDRFPWTRRAPVHAADIAVLPPLRAYLQGAAAIPASLQDDLRQLASRVAPRSLRIPLDIDPALERLPWEALLCYPVLAGESDVPRSLDFWRRGEPLPETGQPSRPRHPRRVCVLADSTRRLFAERAALARDLSFLDLSASDGTDVNRTVERSGAPGLDPPDIVLVIGRRARTQGTVLLQVAEQASARGTSADELREVIVGSGLLEPEVVAGLRARLFIVLGAPTESGSRFDTERRDAADLRGWAADVLPRRSSNGHLAALAGPRAGRGGAPGDRVRAPEGNHIRHRARRRSRSSGAHRDMGSARGGIGGRSARERRRSRRASDRAGPRRMPVPARPDAGLSLIDRSGRAHERRTEPVGSRRGDGGSRTPGTTSTHRSRRSGPTNPYDDAPLEPGGSYLRLWLSEMFLTRRVAWGREWFPAVHSEIRLQFGGQDVAFSKIAASRPWTAWVKACG